MAQRRLRKIDRLEQELAASSGTLDDIKRIAESLKWLESRFLARPAAELMVERADPDAAQLSTGLAATPVLGRERHGDLLRAAFKQALAKEGIPPEVDADARAFYARGGHHPKGGHRPEQQQEDWIATSDTGGLMSTLRRLIGGR